MKNLILALTIVFPLLTFANEAIRLDGMYTYKQVEVSQVRDVELVPSLNTARYNELVKDKYQCYLRGDFFMCQKFIKGAELPEGIKSEVNRAWDGRFFNFIASSFDPEMTNESDSLLEWDIFATVRFEGFQVSEYHYYLLKGENDVHKISLNFASGQKWFVVENESTLSMPIQKTERKSPLKSRVFELSLIFNK
ncbi:hypothetical protein DOM21_13760 [Bacteriovorax stolpii]|uniref:Uncharacterized protein n=1 Tax=Bacteriovorax stolpii TaxID=960 RepID=A0A2K9NRZ7_BACTC|nr:hypothetical protein [Bacteriovorax stolpii]AUN97534.1 hypothetical protein C0V70_05285 [Bacteriovorax stolpii]QDK42493.1 hypothetical protein DOM21_13760 [Bacteriovorax stolpii]TDP52714.1 hypothetical protein C8D79_2480 [Bacteriovorax stolpii]